MKENHGSPMKQVTGEILKWVVAFVVSFAVMGLCVTVYNNAIAVSIPDGTVYTGSAKGFGGDVTAEVTVSEGKIVDVKLTGEAETPELGGKALAEMPAKIVEAQAASVDGVSGATVTSEAVRTAVNQALEQAGLAAPAVEAVETTGAAEPAIPYQDILVSYNANKDNTYIVDYLETDPYLVSLYEGFGFAKEYGSARGHAYCLEDLEHTARPHPLANCLTCKTADFTKLVNSQGVSAYSLDYETVIAGMKESVGCYSCHGDEAETTGALVVTHDYIIDRLGDNLQTVDPVTLSCGQCHIEYYFVPENKATSIPYTSVAEMTPEAMLAYYDSIGFSDWTQPSTGTPMLKAQHPEMETYLNGSIHATLGMDCAACHMEKRTSADGVAYTSHELVSPLDSPAILETCVQCHKDTDMTEKVRSLQAEITARETKVGNSLASFKEQLAQAVASGDYTEEELTALRTAYRQAQWFFDYDYVENSEGAHNSHLANHCLDQAEALMEEGMKLFHPAAEAAKAEQ